METDSTNTVPADEPSNGEGSSNIRKRKIPIRTKLFFGSGAFVEGTVTAGGITTMILYNQVHGMSPALFGLAFMIAMVVDAISDPLIGGLSDRVNTRWGRRHPFMLASILPLVIAFYCLYQPPSGLSEQGLLIWLVVCLVIVRLSQSFYSVPHDALGAELTDDYHERTSLYGWNWVIQTSAGLIMVMGMLWYVFPSTPEYENGLLNVGQYRYLAAFGALIAGGAVLVCSIGTRDQIPYLHQKTVYRPSMKEYFGNLFQLLFNRSYLAVCFSWLTLTAAIGILGVVSTYTYLYGYTLSTEQLSLTGWAKIPGTLVALPLAIYMTRKLDKKNAFIAAAIISATLVALPHFFRMAGVFPAPESQFIYLFCIFVPLFTGFMVLPVMHIAVDSQLTDVCDEHEYRTGVRAEGIVFSIRTFALKSTHGFGAFIGGVGLTMIGFPEDAVASELEPEVVNGLLFMAGPLYLAITVAGALCMMMYRMDKKRHDEILAVLEERRAAKEGGDSV
jgi:Na+/melibiose symporter-like transporter